jgi:enoyl-CoA hydratase/carnithine racemase
MSEFWPEEPGQEPPILTEIRDKVAIVTLNRPASMNAWNPVMGTLYFNTLERLAVDPTVNVILVHGAGRGFCAGADLKGLSNIAASGGKTPGRDPRRYWYPLSIGKPIVAAIHGPCYTLGLQQALCCDLRFAARDVRFAAPYAKRGLVAEIGISWLLSRTIGVSNSMELLLSGRTINGEEALRLGLANRVYDADELFARTFEYCATVAAECSPWSMRTIKQQLYHDLMQSLDPAFLSSEYFLKQALTGADFAEGLAAFKEKRQPNFAPLAQELGKLDPWPEG